MIAKLQVEAYCARLRFDEVLRAASTLDDSESEVIEFPLSRDGRLVIVFERCPGAALLRFGEYPILPVHTYRKCTKLVSVVGSNPKGREKPLRPITPLKSGLE